VRHALTLPTGGPCADPRFLVDLGVRAEASGWDGVFIEDYVLFQGDPTAPTCDPWIALAALAVRTERIKLATKVTPLARRRPWNVARQAVAIDQLSNGRMILGAGLGDIGDHVVRDASFTHFGEAVDARVRAAMLDEALEVIAGLWTGEPFSFSGQHFQVKEVTFKPRSVQNPRIPIWIGGGYPLPGPTTRALRWDGSMLYRAAGREPLEPADVAWIRGAALKPGYDISVRAPRSGDPRADAERLQELGAAGATWASIYVEVQDAAEMRRIVERGPVPAT
jgi:alkanesulfonate monooxygenase SsuD/methylene tetrahydromethanopterin reductase-like flavin-dependent oxidoreductase (luciferase family)